MKTKHIPLLVCVAVRREFVPFPTAGCNLLCPWFLSLSPSGCWRIPLEYFTIPCWSAINANSYIFLLISWCINTSNHSLNSASLAHWLLSSFETENSDDWLEVTSCSSSAELLTPSRAAKSPISRTALLCGGALHCSLGCERLGPCYRWAVFISDDLAIHGGACSPATGGQGDVVAFFRPRR
jgi:hypothetical protein